MLNNLSAIWQQRQRHVAQNLWLKIVWMREDHPRPALLVSLGAALPSLVV